MSAAFTQSAKAARNYALARCADDAALLDLVRRFDTAERMLARFPEVGRKKQRQPTRELPIINTPYVFIYRLDGSSVVILDIRHNSSAS